MSETKPRLRLLAEAETERVQMGDTVFVVRKYSYGLKQDMRRRALVKGRIDEAQLSDLVWKTVLVGWEHLADAKGADIPFSADRVLEVVAALPDEIAEMLLLAAKTPAAATENALGNSMPSSASA